MANSAKRWRKLGRIFMVYVRTRSGERAGSLDFIQMRMAYSAVLL
jgi:hypothetical protein